MGKGKVYPNETSVYYDSISGARVTKLTNYLTHNFHLYFTNIGWYENNQRLLLCSDRGNSSNLYSLEASSGTFTQLTDFHRNDRAGIQGTFINPIKNEAYLTLNDTILSLNLDTYREEKLYQLPVGYRFSNLSVTADGRTLCFGLSEDLTREIRSNLSGGYVGFEETEAARPHSQICLLNLDTKEVTVVHEENRWIGHINTSPTQPHLFTFCHEGPWEKVDHRIWIMDLRTNRVWKLREGAINEFAGHEYWHQDGIHVGYHGFTDSLEKTSGKFLGSIKYDNTNKQEFNFPYQNMHVHSNGDDLIVGDGQQSSAYHGENYQDCIFVWKKTDQKLEGPRILCKHRGSFQTQKVHVHPRFNQDSTQVLFTSDMDGYGNVYIVDMPAFEKLPLLAEVKK